MIVDPLESIMKNTYLYVQMAERNRVLTSLYHHAKQTGNEDLIKIIKTKSEPIKIEAKELEKVLKEYSDEMGVTLTPDAVTIFRPSKTAMGTNQVSVMVDGKHVLMEFDADVARAIKAMDDNSINIAVRILSTPAKTLRAGAVLDPEFFVRNAVRDNITAALYSGNNFKPFIDWFSGAWSLSLIHI